MPSPGVREPITTRNDYEPQPKPVDFDAVVIGGGPAGATAAEDLARKGHSRPAAGPGGTHQALRRGDPPAADQADFAHSRCDMLVARATSARMVSPQADKKVDIPIENGFVGMVNRDQFDEWLRERAASAGRGAPRGHLRAHMDPRCRRHQRRALPGTRPDRQERLGTGQRAGPGRDRRRRCAVAKWHSQTSAGRRASTKLSCSPTTRSSRAPAEQAGWLPDGSAVRRVLPAAHSRRTSMAGCSRMADTISIGTGSADKGFSLRQGVHAAARGQAGLAEAPVTLRREGAPIPMKPLPRWDNGRDVVLAGDAAGVVAPGIGRGHLLRHGRRPAGRRGLQQLLQTGEGQVRWPWPASASCASTAACSGCSASCSASGIRATSAASASSASAATAMCSN